jgi:hypothetical protein
MGTSHEDLFTFVIISRSILIKMRNFSDKGYRDNQNTHFTFNNVYAKSSRLGDNVKRYCNAGQATDDDMACAHCMLGN